MLTLTRAKLSRGSAGEPIPTVFNSLAAEGVHFRRGQFTLIAAAPGVGKSVLATTVSLKSGPPAYYASADTDAFTMYLRAGAMFTGFSTDDIENAVVHKNTQHLDAILEKYNHVRFDFEGRIEVEALEEELNAYTLTYGEWPHIITIDNLSNLDTGDGADGYQALETSCDYLHELGRYTGAAVLGLCHVTGPYDNGITPVPLDGLRGKISKVPEMVLTLHRDPAVGTTGVGTMFVSPVKNRTGKASPDATWSIPLHYAPSRMLLEDRKAQNEQQGY